MSIDDLAPSIAVIPFRSRAFAHDHGVIGEILAEEIIRRLSHSSDLNLVSRLSTTAFSGRDAPLQEVGAHLNVDYVAFRRLQQRRQARRARCRTGETKTGRILWAEKIEDDITSILSEEQELVGRLIAGIAAAVTTRELQRSRSQPLPTLKAYTLLMGAVSLMHRLSLPDFEEAHRLLRR